MKRKGFTLVELLAVIVILAVIALIATPMILGVIETARKGAAESSALGYLDAIEKQIMINEVSGNTALSDGVYNLPIEGISIKGEVPSEGWVIIKDSEIKGYSMKIMDYVVTVGSGVTEETEVVEKPNTNYVCKRATNLHTEECTQTDSEKYCSGAGYVEGNKGTTITYGNIGTIGEDLVSGDALDCDVNGDGIYDAETERFYFVSGLDGNNESDIAVLIYYNNTTSGLPDNTSNSLMAYYISANENWHGPITAIKNLPTLEQWNNVKLSNPNRTITNELSGIKTGNDLNLIDNPFSYDGYGERLLTYQEIINSCGIEAADSLDNCNYLMENTSYSLNVGFNGYWIENPYNSNSNSAWFVSGRSRYLGHSYVTDYSNAGTRPAIEVPKTKILH